MAPADLLSPLEGQREETLRVLDSLTDADLDRAVNGSGRNIRRVFAHVASAELGQAFLIRLAAEGEVVHLSAEDRDRFNEAQVEDSDGWDCRRLKDELRESRMTLRECFQLLTEEDLDRAIRWPEWPARTIRSSIPYMLEHEDSHVDEVRRALER
jgi:uncharacterized damage-inducible protein DinB